MSYRTGYKRSRDLPYRGAPSVAPLGQLGITGTYLSGGQITGKEQNLRITGQNWIREAEEMLATDPVVAASWRVLKQTLLEASWRWVPGDENDEHA